LKTGGQLGGGVCREKSVHAAHGLGKVNKRPKKKKLFVWRGFRKECRFGALEATTLKVVVKGRERGGVKSDCANLPKGKKRWAVKFAARRGHRGVAS